MLTEECATPQVISKSFGIQSYSNCFFIGCFDVFLERKQSVERRPSNERKPGLERKPSLEKRASVDDFSKPAQGALDVEFAKSLREFFREARDIQNGMKDMRDYGKVNADKDIL